MTRFRTHIKMIAVLLLAAMAAVFLPSCGEAEDEMVFLVYYVNSAQDDIIYKSCRVDQYEQMSPEELTDYLLVRMFDTDLTQEQLFSAKPKGVELNSYKINGGSEQTTGANVSISDSLFPQNNYSTEEIVFGEELPICRIVELNKECSRLSQAVDEIVAYGKSVVEYLRGFSPIWRDLMAGKKAFIL